VVMEEFCEDKESNEFVVFSMTVMRFFLDCATLHQFSMVRSSVV
jgi:hypothetical protein